jgi:hypothetical protein
MKAIVVLHHLGLGDHIMYNGLVRFLSRQNKIILFVWERYFKEISYMYRDVDNLQFCRLFLETQEEVDHNINTIAHDERLIIGNIEVNGVIHNNTDVNSNTYLFEQYESVHVPRNTLYDFYVQDDHFMENKVYDIFKQITQNKKYILVHQDPSRNFLLDMSKIQPRDDCILFDIGLNKFTSSFRIFHFKKVLENAEEFHGYNSFWIWLLEFWNITIPKYNHLYVRRDLNPEKYMKTENWKIIS